MNLLPSRVIGTRIVRDGCRRHGVGIVRSLPHPVGDVASSSSSSRQYPRRRWRDSLFITNDMIETSSSVDTMMQHRHSRRRRQYLHGVHVEEDVVRSHSSHLVAATCDPHRGNSRSTTTTTIPPPSALSSSPSSTRSSSSFPVGMSSPCAYDRRGRVDNMRWNLRHGIFRHWHCHDLIALLCFL